jgi:hypothetical protein
VLRTLSAISDLRLRSSALAARLVDDGALLEELDGIVRRAEQGSGPDRDVLLAFVHARVKRADLPIAALAEKARSRGLLAAERVLGTDGAPRSLARLGRLPEPLLPARAVHALPQHPSFTRAGWRQRTAPIRERLLRDPRAEVIARVLEIEGTSLGDVLRLASRRPSTPAIARTVAASRWLSERSVREALVRNPFTEQWLARAIAVTIGGSS